MNSQPPRSKKGWGSLLSGAVAGIESRLDNILAEENALAAQKASDQRTGPTVNGASITSSTTVSRTPSTRRVKTPLGQARSQTPQPPQKLPAPRPSTESATSDSAVPTVKTDRRLSQEQGTRSSIDTAEESIRSSVETQNTSSDLPQPAGESEGGTNGEVTGPALVALKSSKELLSELQQVRADYENVELRRQEEVHDYLERIDALQAKLQYLAKEASETARKTAAEAGQHVQEKKIAEKDEKIALLFEEGTKLSKSEVSQLGTIRNLRAEKAEQLNSIADLKRKLAILENTSRERAYELSRLEVERKEALTRASKLTGLENELESLKNLMSSRDEKIIRLEQEVEEANMRADDETKQRNAEALDIERATSSSLHDEITKIRNDFASYKDQSNIDAYRAHEQMRATNERSQATEAALRNEITTLEGRLEIMRSKTEETTATNTSDSNTKLMRQVEVLQRQYSVASENWQGIEASLQSRITNLEKERDESTKHENEARRKAREVGSSLRKLQDQLDDSTQRTRVFEHEVAEHRTNVESIQKKANEFEKRLNEANEKFDREKQSWSTTLQTKLDEERSKWQSQFHSVDPSIFSGSPHPSNPRRTSTLDLPGLSTRRHDRKSTPNLTLGSSYRDPHSRRSSALPPMRASEPVTSPSNDSGPPTPFFGNAINVPPTPSLHTNDREPDDDFENNSSPHRTINDMISASTAAAGPSVQLVERMSASVRRLETEKATNREELARLASQRDEARKEIVNLMQEVDSKRDIDKKADKLEIDLIEMQRRYAASLEMLGEKEEKVGELQADVADLKKIYRELVERTVK